MEVEVDRKGEVVLCSLRDYEQTTSPGVSKFSQMGEYSELTVFYVCVSALEAIQGRGSSFQLVDESEADASPSPALDSHER